MEQAYRRLIRELENHPLVKRIDDADYYAIKLTWESGVRERLVFNRYENNEFMRLRYLRSPVYRPHFLPKARWWDRLSNGKHIKPSFQENINLIENDPEDYPMLINWRWSDYLQGRFFERLILIHEILDYITKHGWTSIKYPESTLNEDLQSVFSQDLKNYRFKWRHAYRFFRFTGALRPGEKILKHFLPIGFYGKYQPSYLMSVCSRGGARRVYKAIRNVIATNNRLHRNTRWKKRYDINYDTILKFMNIRGYGGSYGRAYRKKFRHIGLYRRLIQDFELSGKSFFDIDPYMGEKSLAAFAQKCPYFFRPTPPFDTSFKPMADFLSAEFNCYDENARYDFTIYDNDLSINIDRFKAVMEELPHRVDMAIIFMNNEYMDEFVAKFPPDNGYHMRLGRFPPKNGKWLTYYF